MDKYSFLNADHGVALVQLVAADPDGLDLSAITFNTPLYQWDDAFDDWSLGEDDEPNGNFA